MVDTQGMTEEQIAAFEMAEARNAVRDEKKILELTNIIRQTAYDIHVYFGNGYLEKVYENTLKHRLEALGHSVLQQVKMVVRDADGFAVGTYEADLVVDAAIIIELKAVKALNGAHEAQLVNYLKTTGIKDGILINFGSEKFEIVKKVCDKANGAAKFIFDGTPAART